MKQVETISYTGTSAELTPRVNDVSLDSLEIHLRKSHFCCMEQMGAPVMYEFQAIGNETEIVVDVECRNIAVQDADMYGIFFSSTCSPQYSNVLALVTSVVLQITTISLNTKAKGDNDC